MGATPPRVFHWSFWNYAYLFYIIWRCACGLGVILLLFLSTFSTKFFPGSVSIKIDILWAQLLLDLSTYHLETMHTFSNWSEDEHMVYGYPIIFFFELFALFQLSFCSCDTITRVACGRNSSYSFILNFLKLCRCLFCSWSADVHVLLGLSSHYYFYQLFPRFRHRFLGQISIRIDTL